MKNKIKKLLNSKFLNAFLVGANVDYILDLLIHGSKHFVLNLILSLLVIIGCSYSYYTIEKEGV
ncbi:hypothetical protein [Clostridium sp. DJ247]|uniref:hypothetical protein n=1 Tax=Clostridium sp. DJ247 TaxID=2726188 RepID=UPI0016244333|nr:hypothetical protein [Clostridium sp. DJ247]MBC2579972.1 hypothetical protein [Clostridium sp. DJ247]